MGSRALRRRDANNLPTCARSISGDAAGDLVGPKELANRIPQDEQSRIEPSMLLCRELSKGNRDIR